MKYKLIFTDSYNNKAKKILKKNSQLIEIYRKTLKLLELNPHHPSLRLHKLKGKYKNLYSISINMMYRITFEFMIKDKQIIFINIGGHATVY